MHIYLRCVYLTWDFRTTKWKSMEYCRKKSWTQNKKNKRKPLDEVWMQWTVYIQHHMCVGIYIYIDFDLICSDRRRVWMQQLKQEVLSFMVSYAVI